MIDWLKGKKTYFIVAGGIIAAVVAYLNDTISLSDAIEAILAALGLSTLKAGQNRIEAKAETIEKKV